MSVKPIFFALDGPNLNEFEFMLKKLEGHIFGVKVGLEMFISEGPKVVEKLKKDGWTVFLCLLYTSPSPRDVNRSRMPSSA